MKIEKSGITITEVPGVHKIVVERADEGPVSVMIYGEEGISGEWGVEALTGLHEAIGVALEHAANMATPVAPTSNAGPRAFFGVDVVEPGPEVTAVKDVDGDVWVRVDGGWRMSRSMSGNVWPWSSVLESAPLTEVHR
jgi:hypothetical protein